MSVSRRTFLSSALATGAALGLGGSDLFALDAATAIPGKDKLIVNSYRFLDLEMPLDQLRSWITPIDLFFVRNHVSEPFAIDVAAYRLNVVGEVEQPLSLTLEDLRKLEPAAVTCTLECAGNGRANYQPPVPGVQWRRGAVGNARFAGPRLRDILDRAGLKSTARHVAFKGLEEPPGKVPQFVRSIPIEKASDPDTLVALSMNGAPLLKHHGFPARALVPGWIGAASCKWLTEVRVLDREFDGNYMKPGYRMPKHALAPGADADPNDTSPVTALNVKSVIAQPVAGSQLRAGALRITGAAWAGEADVARVEVSTDGGNTWQPARLGADQARYAWRLFDIAWHPSPGSYTLMARATDTQGRTQPETAPWNPGGYLWNGIDQVNVNVR